MTCNQQVSGSIPDAGSIVCNKLRQIRRFGTYEKAEAARTRHLEELARLGLSPLMVGVVGARSGSRLDQERAREETAEHSFGDLEAAAVGQTLQASTNGLSVPDFEAEVERSESVILHATDLEGEQLVVEASQLQAVCFQHEVDHLDGVLFIDRISRLKRNLYVQRRKKQLRRELEDD